jgi:hypothetical protein
MAAFGGKRRSRFRGCLGVKPEASLGRPVVDSRRPNTGSQSPLRPAQARQAVRIVPMYRLALGAPRRACASGRMRACDLTGAAAEGIHGASVWAVATHGTNARVPLSARRLSCESPRGCGKSRQLRFHSPSRPAQTPPRLRSGGSWGAAVRARTPILTPQRWPAGRHGTLSLKRLPLPGAVREVRDRCRALARLLRGTGSNALVPALVAVDKDCRPLSRAISLGAWRGGVPSSRRRLHRRRYPAGSHHSAQLTVIRCRAPDRGRAQLEVGAPSRFSLPPLAVRVRAASKSGGRFWRKASMPS